MERLLKRMGWFIHFKNNPEAKTHEKETYGFKSNAAPPPEPQRILDPFAKYLAHLVRTIEFKDNLRCDFQSNLKTFISDLKKSDEVLVPADKSRCFYKMKPGDYRQLVKNNITKDYKQAPPSALNEANRKAREVAEELELDDRIQVHSENPAFVSLKDHKENFRCKDLGKKPCRLINPAKPDVGKVSKIILQAVTSEIKLKTGLNQWQSTDEVLHWFQEFKNKQDYRFFKFDVEAFYPSIKEQLLQDAIQWTRSQQVEITERDEEIIMTSRQNFLFFEGLTWTKKENPQFDITMGSFDGAEVCELVGLFLLDQLTGTGLGIQKHQVGLCRDDGLMIIRGSKRELDSLQKQVERLFSQHSLKITTETGMKSTDFLDVTLHLGTGVFEPFRKDELLPVYVHKRSNHPGAITKKHSADDPEEGVQQMQQPRDV